MTKRMTSSTNHRTANSIEEMQQIALNQIQAKIWQLQDRIDALKQVNVINVTDWKSYERETANINEYDDDQDLTALKELGEYYETMRAGNYF